MIAAFFIGAAIAFVLAMPPGPISVYSIKTALESGLKKGLFVGLGASAMDVVYSFIAMMATSAVVGEYDNFTRQHPLADFLVRVTIILILIIFGISQLRAGDSQDEKDQEQSFKKEERARGFLKSFKGPFFVGVAMALVNAIHPTFLPALAAQAVTVQHNGWVDPDKISEISAFAVGFGCGNMAWMFVLLKIVLRFKHHVSLGFMQKLKKVVALVFIVFGVYLGIRVALKTNWDILFASVWIV